MTSYLYGARMQHSYHIFWIMPIQITLILKKKHDNFLDLTLEGDINTSRVVTSIYRKPDGGSTILDANSCHPKSTIHSIPKGEYIRIKRACSEPNTFKSKVQHLNERLCKQGCNKWLLKRAFNTVQMQSRESLLFTNHKNREFKRINDTLNNNLTFSTDCSTFKKYFL